MENKELFKLELNQRLNKFKLGEEKVIMEFEKELIKWLGEDFEDYEPK